MHRAFFVCVFLLLPSSAFAQVELTAQVGYRFGGPSLEGPPIFCVLSPCPQPDDTEARDGEAYGLVLDLPIKPQLAFEVLVSHQSGEYEDTSFAFIDLFPFARRKDFDLTYLQIGLQRRWERKVASPFAAVGVGIVQVGSDRLLSFATIDENRLSASLAGGVRFPINKWLGVRAEARGYWADMPEEFSKDLFQLEVSSGLTFRL